MTILITDDGFSSVDTTLIFAATSDASPDSAIDLPSDADPETIALDAKIMRIAFPSFADGRGFTIARILRARGYTGRLRAHGHVLADQYAMARRSGFDEVEISDELAARQPEDQWRARANWKDHDYRARLRHASV